MSKEMDSPFVQAYMTVVCAIAVFLVGMLVSRPITSLALAAYGPEHHCIFQICDADFCADSCASLRVIRKNEEIR